MLGRCDDVLNVAGHRIGMAEWKARWCPIPPLPKPQPLACLTHAGRDHQRWEEAKVFVQVRADHVASDALSAALIEHVRRELGPIATPSSLEFVGKFCGAFLGRKRQASTRAMFPPWKADRPPRPENFGEIMKIHSLVSRRRVVAVQTDSQLISLCGGRRTLFRKQKGNRKKRQSPK